MTYIFFTDNDVFADNIISTLNLKNKENKIYISDFKDESIKKVKKYISSDALIFIGSDNDDSMENNNLVCLLAGYFISQDNLIFTNFQMLKSFSLIKKENLYTFNTTDDLCKTFEKKLNNITKIIKQKSCKKELLEKGIPFTADCCSLYISKNKPEIYDLFIDAGLDINQKNDEGTPLLNVAVRYDNLDLVKRLIDLSADINCISDDRGYTPVMDAVWRGNKEITELLIIKGADLNTINKEGQNNLVLAVGANKIEICDLLAKNGADPDIKDSMGMSAYEYAKLFKKTEILEILEKYHK